VYRDLRIVVASTREAQGAGIWCQQRFRLDRTVVFSLDVDTVYDAGLGFRAEPNLFIRVFHAEHLPAASPGAGPSSAVVVASVHIRARARPDGVLLLAATSLDADGGQLFR
jgi:hypothetical protein